MLLYSSRNLKDLNTSYVQCTPITNDDRSKLKETLATLVGKMMEWHGFAVLGCFTEVAGDFVLPPQEGVLVCTWNGNAKDQN